MNQILSRLTENLTDVQKRNFIKLFAYKVKSLNSISNDTHHFGESVSGKFIVRFKDYEREFSKEDFEPFFSQFYITYNKIFSEAFPNGITINKLFYSAK